MDPRTGQEERPETAWYIRCQPNRPGMSVVRRRLAEQGIRRVETVTDQVLRCWSVAQPILPSEWSCEIARDESGGVARELSPPAIAPGALVRIGAGPARGWVGRVRTAREDRLAVEILVWGKGMSVQVSTRDVEPVGGVPWERPRAF